ncbi:MAG TPA: ABC transporter ATP-binding protein [Sandaracinaceae bacterium LLY-WYZ-13_1]|nr:ABC transporter ATP-binding protein [Sandaracinaceae bacterium LLY-WYZ-13_1]
MSRGDDDAVLRVTGLHKTFRIGFFRKRVEAVRGIDFEVRPGEIFGLLGPNGAGKTTSIKSVLRLVFPDRGTVSLFGQENPGPEVMRRVGYLPENPYVYQYLAPLEFLDLCGRLVGMSRRERRERGEALIDEVGLGHAVDRPIGKFSKGMMQRIGLAQALLHDPELLILDEPMSGLDPIGRKEVRDLILEQRRLGKTILFTSHILSDVEMLCDRVGIMRRGRMSHYGRLTDLVRAETRRVEIELEGVDEALADAIAPLAAEVRTVEGLTVVTVQGGDGAQPIVTRAVEAGARVVAVTAARETLEDLFVRDALTDADAEEAREEAGG